MARIRIAAIERVLGSFEIPVRIGDVNYGGHVGNDSILSLVHEARVQFLCSRQMSELDVGAGVGLIMADAAVMYQAESFYGDLLRIDVGMRDFTELGCDMVFQIKRIPKSDKIDECEIARIKCGMVGFDHARRSVAALPSAFRALAAV